MPILKTYKAATFSLTKMLQPHTFFATDHKELGQKRRAKLKQKAPFQNVRKVWTR